MNGRNNDWDYADEQKTHFDRIAPDVERLMHLIGNCLLKKLMINIGVRKRCRK